MSDLAFVCVVGLVCVVGVVAIFFGRKFTGKMDGGGASLGIGGTGDTTNDDGGT